MKRYFLLALAFCFFALLGRGSKDLPEDLRKRYMEREGYFSDVASNETQRSLNQSAEV